MKTLQAITRLFFLFFYFAVCLTLTASPSTTPNNRYSNAGHCSITQESQPSTRLLTTTQPPPLSTPLFSQSASADPKPQPLTNSDAASKILTTRSQIINSTIVLSPVVRILPPRLSWLCIPTMQTKSVC